MQRFPSAERSNLLLVVLAQLKSSLQPTCFGKKQQNQSLSNPGISIIGVVIVHKEEKAFPKLMEVEQIVQMKKGRQSEKHSDCLPGSHP